MPKEFDKVTVDAPNNEFMPQISGGPTRNIVYKVFFYLSAKSGDFTMKRIVY